MTKITYSQDWVAYDKAKTKESKLFKSMLWELLENYFSYEIKQGKRISNKDRLFMMALKVYYNTDFRKCKGLIEEFTGKNVSYKSLSNFFNDKDLEQYIDDLILITSIPLASLEKTGAIDATGFSSSNFAQWNNYKWGTHNGALFKESGKERIWRKAHAMGGCKTNTIISVKITKKEVPDVKMFEKTIGNKTKYFDLDDFVADKAYNSRAVFLFLREINIDAIIPFKKNVTGKARGSMYWTKMFKYFKDHREEFDKRYHKRSNIETTFSMIKKKFGSNVKTKGFDSNVNEIKLKFLCHNICVLIQEIYESNIDIDFESCVNTIASV